MHYYSVHTYMYYKYMNNIIIVYTYKLEYLSMSIRIEFLI